LSFLLDTNACIALIKGRPPEVRAQMLHVISDGSGIAVSSIAVFELWYGVIKSAYPDRNTRQLAEFLAAGVALLPFDEEDAQAAGQVRAKMEAKGRPIGPYDVLLAGQALRHGLTLVTANVAEFARVPHLKWQDWAAPRR
jgi:tRNA(fMet)-specific endonuclease VapC